MVCSFFSFGFITRKASICCLSVFMIDRWCEVHHYVVKHTTHNLPFFQVLKLNAIMDITCAIHSLWIFWVLLEVYLRLIGFMIFYITRKNINYYMLLNDIMKFKWKKNLKHLENINCCDIFVACWDVDLALNYGVNSWPNNS